MRFLSLSSKNHHHYTVPDPASTWPWPYCHQPRTLSFRDADPIFKTINSTFVLDSAVDTSGPSVPIAASSSEESPSFSTAPSELPDDCADDDDAAVESLIRCARSERRLFFEPSRGDINSILADQGSRSNAEANENAREANKDDDDEDVAFKKENVTLLAMESKDPYEDFRKSMEEMVEAHGVKGDDWECLEELLCWYLRVNDRDNHGYIYGAFVDLLVHGDRRRRHHQCRLPGHQSPSSPLSLYNTSSSSLSSTSSSSLSARCGSVSEAEETVSESTPCSFSSSGVSLEVAEDEEQLRRSSSSSGA